MSSLWSVWRRFTSVVLPPLPIVATYQRLHVPGSFSQALCLQNAASSHGVGGESLGRGHSFMQVKRSLSQELAMILTKAFDSQVAEDLVYAQNALSTENYDALLELEEAY